MSILDFDKLIYHHRTVSSIIEGRPAFPVHATLSLGNFCNHECLWCSVYEKQLEKAKLTDFGRLAAFLEKAAGKGLKAISYIGNGEPTVYPDFGRLIEHAAEIGLQQAMFTNGFLLDRFAEKILKNFTWLRISLDAGNPESHAKFHGAEGHFEKILLNIKMLSAAAKNRMPMIGVQFAVHDVNIGEMYDAALLSKQNGAHYFSIKPVFSRGAVGEKIDRNSLTPQEISDEAERIKNALASDGFEVFYRHFQSESEFCGKTVLKYKNCFASYFNIIVNEDDDIITCGPRNIKWGKITDDIEKLAEKISLINLPLDISKCPAGCRYHPLNSTLYEIMHPETTAEEKHIYFI